MEPGVRCDAEPNATYSYRVDRDYQYHLIPAAFTYELAQYTCGVKYTFGTLATFSDSTNYGLVETWLDSFGVSPDVWVGYTDAFGSGVRADSPLLG